MKISRCPSEASDNADDEEVHCGYMDKAMSSFAHTRSVLAHLKKQPYVEVARLGRSKKLEKILELLHVEEPSSKVED